MHGRAQGVSRRVSRAGDGPDFDVAGFLARIAAAAASTHAAVGDGEDWRLDDLGVAGGALLHGERVVHLCAFPAGDERVPSRGAQGPGRSPDRRAMGVRP